MGCGVGVTAIVGVYIVLSSDVEVRRGVRVKVVEMARVGLQLIVVARARVRGRVRVRHSRLSLHVHPRRGRRR